MATESEIRDLERAECAAARDMRAAYSAGHPMCRAYDAARAATDAARSPLPSRDELRAAFEAKPYGLDQKHSDYWGAYWLRWLAGYMVDGGFLVPTNPLLRRVGELSKELEARK